MKSDRELEMVIHIPKDKEGEFRLFTVLYGGEIVNVFDLNRISKRDSEEACNE